MLLEIRVPSGRSLEEASQLRTIKDIVLERQMTRNKSSSFRKYDLAEFGVTRGYLKSAVARPDLTEGMRLLAAIRVGLFPSLQGLMKRAQDKGLSPHVSEGGCPFCSIPVVAELWSHMMLRCEHPWVAEMRRDCLASPISTIRRGSPWDGLWNTELEDGTLEVDEERHEMALGYALVGGWYHVVGNEVPTWSLGFGQLDVVSDELSSYGSTYVAEFLQRTYPLYSRHFGVKEYTSGGKVQGAALEMPPPAANEIEFEPGDYDV